MFNHCKLCINLLWFDREAGMASNEEINSLIFPFLTSSFTDTTELVHLKLRWELERPSL